MHRRIICSIYLQSCCYIGCTKISNLSKFVVVFIKIVRFKQENQTWERRWNFVQCSRNVWEFIVSVSRCGIARDEIKRKSHWIASDLCRRSTGRGEGGTRGEKNFYANSRIFDTRRVLLACFFGTLDYPWIKSFLMELPRHKGLGWQLRQRQVSSVSSKRILEDRGSVTPFNFVGFDAFA